MNQGSASLVIEPIVSWPREAEVGRSYLVTVNLRSPQGSAEWPYEEEEFRFGLSLDGAPHFVCETLDDPSVVLHRFGGSYGPARFILATGPAVGPGAIWLTISNRWGVPVRTIKLPTEVVTASASDATPIGIADAGPWEAAGDSADLDAAIDAGRQALALTPPDHPDRARYLSALGSSLLARFEQSADLADLDAAIDAGRQALALTPPDHPDRARYLSALGSSLLARFEQSADLADLDAAIDAGRQALALTPPDHPDRARYLSALGSSLLARFEQSADLADLDAAIDAGRQALALTPPDHPDRARYLSALGSSLLARFEQSADLADLDAAIDAGRQALALTPPDHPDRARYLSALGSSLLARFEQSADLADLDAAIDAGRQALALTPPDHPDRARYLSALGSSLLARFEQSADLADLDAALSCWQQASQVPTGTPSVRLTAARRWGTAAADAGRTHEAVEGYATALTLLPQVTWHGLDRRTREEQGARWAGLAADAAACAILDDRPELAVELLEQGRSVLWNQVLDLRSDLTRLAERAPGLAARLENIRAVLDSPVYDQPLSMAEPVGGSGPIADRTQQQDVADLRMRAAREWDDVVKQVRTLEGYEHFLRPVSFAELEATAVGGAVVILNASRHGCHALVVNAGSEPVRIVSLPGLSLDAAVEHANAMLRILTERADVARSFSDREKDRHAVLDILGWLWDEITEPVLTTLGHTSTPIAGSPWPRVWWCPTGPLTVLPIHAAGHHPRLRTAIADITDCVIDRVISSYTSTLTALARSRQPTVASTVRQLTVGMPTTPGLPQLPAVTDELNVLARHFPAGQDNHQLVGPQATRAAVLTAMAAHSWIHLACYATGQYADPARSGFALWDATLTITDLSQQRAQRQDLAFLSACQTATGGVSHPDEATYLAAAMQFLGYRHVIATMWAIPDSSAPQVADAFYTTLSQGSTPELGRVAEALHQALRSLRQTDPGNPLSWAAYIHLGI